MGDVDIQERLAETIRLNNGLELKLYNGSKKLAGDRWFLALIARIEIDVKEHWTKWEKDPDLDLPRVLEITGEKVVFKKKISRNFIDEKEKENLFQAMKDSFLSTTLSYLSKQKFAVRFIYKTFKELSERKTLYQK